MEPIPKTDRRVVNIFQSLFTPIQSNGKPDGEEFLIIQGDLRDHDGIDYGPGDLVWLHDGTVHNSTTKNGGLIAVCALEPDF